MFQKKIFGCLPSVNLQNLVKCFTYHVNNISSGKVKKTNLGELKVEEILVLVVWIDLFYETQYSKVFHSSQDGDFTVIVLPGGFDTLFSRG